MTVAATDIDFLPHVKETVTIVRPMPSVVPRGRASSREVQPTRTFRLRSEVLEAMDEAAVLLGMSRSAFVSWCSYYVAQDIIRQHQEFLKRRQK